MHNIFINNLDLLRKVDFPKRNLNFLIEHDDTDLDDKVTPLAAASFLGRHEIVVMMLQNPMVDIDMPTQNTGLTPLTSSWCSGHYLVVKTLVENGADVNLKTGLDYSPLYYWFTRMNESTNIFENKGIWIKIADVLLQAGADINVVKSGKTLLMKFWGISYQSVTGIQK